MSDISIISVFNEYILSIVDLPMLPFVWAQIVENPSGGVILVGGSTTNGTTGFTNYDIFGLSSLCGQWTKMTQKPVSARYKFVAMLIPDTTTSCAGKLLPLTLKSSSDLQF